MRRPARWILVRVVAVVLVVVAAAFGIDLPSGRSPEGAAMRDRPESPVPGTHHVRLTGVDYAIPRAHWHGDLEPGLDQRTILLQGLHPGFVAPTALQRGELLHQRGHGNQIRVLLTSGPFLNPPMRTRWEARWRSRGPFIEAPPFLDFYRYVTPPPDTEQGYELYRTSLSQMAEDIIFCYAVNSGPSPGCEYFFMVDGSVASVSFARRFLPDARRIRRDVEAFFSEARDSLARHQIQTPDR